MTTITRIKSMVDGHGFRHVDSRGMVRFQREHEDSRQQELGVFHWSNPKIAAQNGLPHSYIVCCVSYSGMLIENGRFRIPVVEWDSPQSSIESQTIRPWADVTEEFQKVVMPIFEQPLVDGETLLKQLVESERYAIV